MKTVKNIFCSILKGRQMRIDRQVQRIIRERKWDTN